MRHLCFRADTSQGGKRCLDVDECKQRPSPCQHECENTFGSYKCSCPPGYKLNEHTNTCMDIDECTVGDAGGPKCEYECLNTPGGYECVCPPGFSQLGHRCLDIDECVEQQVKTCDTALINSTTLMLIGWNGSIFSGPLSVSRHLQEHQWQLPMRMSSRIQA